MADDRATRTAHPGRQAPGRRLRPIGWGIAAPILIVVAACGAVLLYFSPLPWAPLRAALAAAFVLCVAASALRELLIEQRGAGRDARESFKIGQVLLASPDADMDVVSQRFEAERFFRVAEHVTVYVSARDRALGLADWVHRSRRRLGQLRPQELTPDERLRLGKGDLDIVDARVATGPVGHNYFHSNPAVSSDLYLLLRWGYAAGTPQRPLKNVAPHYWVLDDEAYPQPGPGTGLPAAL